MITCKKCGSENALGRIFCGSCGERLDLDNMTSDHVDSLTKQEAAAPVKKMVIAALIVVVLFIVAVALWPQGAPIGTAGNASDGRRAEAQIKGAARVTRGERKFTVNEADLNGYFADRGLAALPGVKSLSVDIGASQFSVRMVKVLVNLPKVKEKDLPPLTMSFEVTCEPTEEGVTIKGGWLGHLPIAGAAKLLKPALLGAFAGSKEWGFVTSIASVALEEGKAAVIVKK